MKANFFPTLRADVSELRTSMRYFGSAQLELLSKSWIRHYFTGLNSVGLPHRTVHELGRKAAKYRHRVAEVGRKRPNSVEHADLVSRFPSDFGCFPSPIGCSMYIGVRHTLVPRPLLGPWVRD